MPMINAGNRTAADDASAVVDVREGGVERGTGDMVPVSNRDANKHWDDKENEVRTCQWDSPSPNIHPGSLSYS